MVNFLKFLYQVFIGACAGLATMALIHVFIHPVDMENRDGWLIVVSLLHYVLIEHWLIRETKK